MLWLWILIAVVVIAVIGGVVSYNRFISQKNLIKDAWANIDTELRRRYDLIPNLVETVKGYAAHEREVFENVTQARAMADRRDRVARRAGRGRGPVRRRAPAAVRRRRELPRPEGEPELPGAAGASSRNTEDRLQTARRFYNAQRPRVQPARAVVPVDARCERFHFEEAEFFEVDEATARGRRSPGGLRHRRLLGRRSAGGAPRRTARGAARRRRRLATCRNRRANPRRRTRPASGRPGRRRRAREARRRPRPARRLRQTGPLRTAAGEDPPDAGPQRRRPLRRDHAAVSRPDGVGDRRRRPGSRSPSDSVINAKSKAKIRPRMWSGTSTCSP